MGEKRYHLLVEFRDLEVDDGSEGEKRGRCRLGRVSLEDTKKFLFRRLKNGRCAGQRLCFGDGLGDANVVGDLPFGPLPPLSVYAEREQCRGRRMREDLVDDVREELCVYRNAGHDEGSLVVRKGEIAKSRATPGVVVFCVPCAPIYV